jgi:hypothetical protein
MLSKARTVLRDQENKSQRAHQPEDCQFPFG